MKIFLAVVLTAFFGLIFWYGATIQSSIRTCSGTHQDDITTSRLRAESVIGDHRIYCKSTYDSISAWDDCVTAVGNTSPQPVVQYIKPVVLNILGIIGDQSGMIQELKLEHDDLCKDQIESMFYPPPMEK